MKKLLFIFLLLTATVATKAQYNAGWDNAINFGGRGSMVEEMRYVNGDLYFVARLIGKYKFAGVNYDPGANIQDYVFGKIKADGTQVLLFKIKANEIGETVSRIGVDGSLYVMRFGNSLSLTVGSLSTPAYGCQIIKIDNAGVPAWIKKLNQFTDDEFGITWSSSTVPAMQVKDDGDIYAIVNSAIKKNSKYPCRVLKLDPNGDEVWNYEMTGSISFRNMPRQFVDDNGNVTIYVQSTGNILFNNESLPFEDPHPAGITFKNWLISLDNAGNKKWNTSTRTEGIFYGVHPVSGQIYLLYGYSKTSPALAPSIAPFSSLPNTSSPASGYYTWQGIIILNMDGSISKSKQEIGYGSQMQIGENRIILNGVAGDGSVVKAGENFVAFNSGGYVATEVDADFKPLKVFKMPTYSLMALNGSKFAVAGVFNNTLTVANTTLNPSDIDGGATKNDILIAQGDLVNIPLTPQTTTWISTSSTDWNLASNWSNGIPTYEMRANFGAGSVVFPTNIPASAKVGQLSVAAGAELKLPGTYGALTIGDRLFNQGKVTAATSGFFNFFGLKQISGSGEFSLNGPAQIFNFNGVIENTLSFDNSISLLASNFSVNKLKFIGTNANFTGDIKVNSSAEDAVTVTGLTNFVNGTLTRAINATGNYLFPLATGNSNEKKTNFNFTATGLVGTTEVAAKYNAGLPTGTTPTVVAKGASITSVLNGGFLTLTPNQQPTAGTYGVGFSVTGSTNTVANPLRYLIIKRDNNTSPWVFQGENNTAPISTGSGTTNTVTTSLDGINSFSDFAMGIGDLPITLPVRLMNFTAKANGNLALLNWQTASELNNDKFEIERSINGTEFIKIGEVKGKGTLQKMSVYNFLDKTPANGANYYRLKQVDFNGKFELSDAKAVNFNLETAAFGIYPNPATDVLNFSSEVTAVEIYNLTGTKVFQLSGNTNSVKIPKSLSSGVYIIKATLKGGAKVSKQLIVK